MKKIGSFIPIFIPLILLFSATFVVSHMGFGSICYGDSLKVSELPKPTMDLKPEIVIPSSEQKIARSGCCSWHGGVCDCIGGRVVCCDGTFSPTCTCHHDDNKDFVNSKE